MERVIRCGFVLLLALIIPIWSAQGKEIQADNHSAFDVAPSNAARAVLLHAATYPKLLFRILRGTAYDTEKDGWW